MGCEDLFNAALLPQKVLKESSRDKKIQNPLDFTLNPAKQAMSTAEFVKKHRARDGSIKFGFLKDNDIEHSLRDRRRDAAKRQHGDLDFYISRLNTTIKDVSIA